MEKSKAASILREMRSELNTRYIQIPERFKDRSYLKDRIAALQVAEDALSEKK